MPEGLSIPYVLLNEGSTMLVTGHDGWIGEDGTGLYAHDTRYLSRYRLTLNGTRPRFLGGERSHHRAADLYYANLRVEDAAGVVPANSIVLAVSRLVDGGLREEVALTNHAGRPVTLRLRFELASDFADIFEVRGLRAGSSRQVAREAGDAGDSFTLRYANGDFVRALHYKVEEGDASSSFADGAVTFDFNLAPNATWRVRHSLTAEPATPKSAADPVEDLRRWQERFPRLDAAPNVERAYERAVLDLAALRLDTGNGQPFPLAGLPWYAAVFGRDSLLAAIQTLPFSNVFVEGVLERLRRLQGTKTDAWTEEEPGKIPHELRVGELARTGAAPYDPYYGTVDASLLYAVLLGEAYRFGGDRDLVARFYPTARRCLEWAERYGDFDGDGFVEYRPLSPASYSNQGWKDSEDAVVYPDGSVVAPPIAVCEVQGYYFDALRHMARLARVMGDVPAAEEYARQAVELAARFDAVFWLPEEGHYAYALDSQKRPLDVRASNQGHLLWSGIVPNTRARLLAAQLLAGDLYSGWGIRTLSAGNRAYSPVSYHRGSVWPHDNAIIALGFKRYGLWQEANRLAEGVFAAAGHYAGSSLPEVFAGLARATGAPPVPYAETCLPQAWSAGSVFLFLRAILGLEADPDSRRLSLAPTLPEWLPELTLTGLPSFSGQVDLHLRGSGPETKVEVLRAKGEPPHLKTPSDRPWTP